jgi:cytochrome c biogenesis protein CcdA
MVLLLCAMGAAALGAEEKSGKQLTVDFFGSPSCGHCIEIKHGILEPIQEQYPEKLDVRIHNIDEEEGYQRMMQLEKLYEVPESSPQELFVADTFLVGYKAIMEHGEALILDRMQRPDTWRAENTVAGMEESGSGLSSTALKERFSQFTFLGILAAGLVDGVNPCAIATMIFLISFLATQKRSRREVLAIGLSFTAAVFVTYLLLGLGAFKALSALEHYRWVSQAVRWSAVGLAGLVGALSFWDALAWKRTGKTDAITLQLPKPIKMRIHKVISGNLTGKQLVTGAIVTGFLVTLLEAVCTGQVYLPTIVLMTRATGLRLTGWLYLVFYNFLFVLPLLIVMILAYFGLRWNKLAKATQNNLSLLKMLLGVVMVGLAVFLGMAG